MRKITCIKSGKHNIYRREDYDLEGNVIHSRVVDVRTAETQTENGVYFSVLDTDGTPLYFVHEFLNNNVRMLSCSVNTRRKYCCALCKLCAFMKLMDYELVNFGSEGIYQLVQFFQGEGPESCSNQTVNAYLSVVRELFQFFHIGNKTLFSKHVVNQAECSPSDLFFHVDHKYDINRPSGSREPEVPKYITMDEYQTLILIAQREKDINAVMLMHLMFRYGMRLGECLGLTEEDVVTMKVGKTDVPTLILRNRISDHHDQLAKGKISPHKDSYESTSYIQQWQRDDYSHIHLVESKDFYDNFLSFIEYRKTHAIETHSENYKKALADIVCPHDFAKKGLCENHYIFIQDNGNRLSAQNWNKTLRRYFKEINIPTDEGKRENNLSHRFRHGFAMVHAPHLAPAELKELMRHRYLSSTFIYYTPTKADKLKKITAVENTIFETCPELSDICGELFNEPWR